MKQSTKVVLPLGLFMSVVIPITVKLLFTEGDLFQNDASESQIDYLQPYKIKPEASLEIPGQTSGTISESQTVRERIVESVDAQQSYEHYMESNVGKEPSASQSASPSIAEMEMELNLHENSLNNQ
jgi:hypothetical protein